MSKEVLAELDSIFHHLREVTRHQDCKPDARSHLERACEHVREAYVATNEIGKARSVRRLVGDLEKAEQITRKVRGIRTAQ